MTEQRHRLVRVYTGTGGCAAECDCGWLSPRHSTQDAARRDLHYQHLPQLSPPRVTLGDTVRVDWSSEVGVVEEISSADMALVQWPHRTRWTPVDLLVVVQ